MNARVISVEQMHPAFHEPSQQLITDIDTAREIVSDIAERHIRGGLTVIKKAARELANIPYNLVYEHPELGPKMTAVNHSWVIIPGKQGIQEMAEDIHTHLQPGRMYEGQGFLNRYGNVLGVSSNPLAFAIHQLLMHFHHVKRKINEVMMKMSPPLVMEEVMRQSEVDPQTKLIGYFSCDPAWSDILNEFDDREAQFAKFDKDLTERLKYLMLECNLVSLDKVANGLVDNELEALIRQCGLRRANSIGRKLAAEVAKGKEQEKLFQNVVDVYMAESMNLLNLDGIDGAAKKVMENGTYSTREFYENQLIKPIRERIDEALEANEEKALTSPVNALRNLN